MAFNEVVTNGVSQHIIDVMEAVLEDEHDAPPMLTFDMEVNRLDAVYIAECLRIIFQQETSTPITALSFDHDEISDEAIDVFGGFLRERTPRQLKELCLWNLPPQQVRRLLVALHTNTSVKELCIYSLFDSEGASWIVDLLHHKTDFEILSFPCCRLGDNNGTGLIVDALAKGSFLALKELTLPGNQIKYNDLRSLARLDSTTFPQFEKLNVTNNPNLFNDQESTQFFVDNLLLSPRSTLKKLCFDRCGVSMENRCLMMGIYRNVTIIELWINDVEIRRFVDPILRRNLCLDYVNGMLGTRKTTATLGVPTVLTLPPTAPSTRMPPPCSFWPTVMAKVGREGSLGATPVFAILQDRLATWIPPSYHRQQCSNRRLQPVSSIQPEPVACQKSSPTTIQSGIQQPDVMRSGGADPIVSTEEAEQQQYTFKKRANKPTNTSSASTSKRPKSDDT